MTPPNAADASDEEDDYMSMTFSDAPAAAAAANGRRGAQLPESSVQRAARERRERAARGLVKSKAELAAEAEEARERGLRTSLLADAKAAEKSKGFRMMQKMGFKVGQGLGRKGPGEMEGGTGGGGGGGGGEDAERGGTLLGGAPTAGLDAKAPSSGGGGGSQGRPAAPAAAAAAEAAGQGLKEPIALSVKQGRGGIGLDAERKRRFEDSAAGVDAKKQKPPPIEELDPAAYRDRVARERAAERMERQLGAAMKIAMVKDEEDGEEGRGGEGGGGVEGRGGKGGDAAKAKKGRDPQSTPLKSVNVLWRGLVRRREAAERDRRMRHDLQDSLPSSFSRVGQRSGGAGGSGGGGLLPTYGGDDGDDDPDYRQAMGMAPLPSSMGGGKKAKNEVYEAADDLDDEDEELAEFDALDVEERLRRVVVFLRERWNYCFWCKFTYPDKTMEGCPGITEEDHD